MKVLWSYYDEDEQHLLFYWGDYHYHIEPIEDEL